MGKFKEVIGAIWDHDRSRLQNPEKPPTTSYAVFMMVSSILFICSVLFLSFFVLPNPSCNPVPHRAGLGSVDTSQYNEWERQSNEFWDQFGEF